jgi:hypothetical protein
MLQSLGGIGGMGTGLLLVDGVEDGLLSGDWYRVLGRVRKENVDPSEALDKEYQ